MHTCLYICVPLPHVRFLQLDRDKSGHLYTIAGKETQYRGVSFSHSGRDCVAQIKVLGRAIHLGAWKATEAGLEKAAKVYDSAQDWKNSHGLLDRNR